MNINDLDKKIYNEFILKNSGKGMLKIRAYAFREALPVEGLNITISTTIDNIEVVFFKGITDSSGIVPTISLPAPKLEVSNLEVPNTITYKIEAYKDNNKSNFTVNMYDGICVVQNINYLGDVYGN